MNVDIIEPFNRIHFTGSPRVSAVHYYHNRLFMGFNNGDLQVYSSLTSQSQKPLYPAAKTLKTLKSFNDIKFLFHDNSQSQQFELDSAFSNLSQDSSAIDSIKCIPISNESNKTILVITTAECVRAYELIGSHINLVQELDDTKSCSDCLYTEYDEHRLFLVGTKKKLIAFKIVNKTRNILIFQKVKEISLKDRVKTIALIPGSGSKILLSLASDFVIVDIAKDFSIIALAIDDPTLYNFNHSTSFSYFGLSSSGPAAWTIKLSEDKLLLVKDTQCVEYTISSQVIRPSAIKLTAVPIFVDFIEPMYIMVVYGKRIEIVDYVNGDRIQIFNHQINSNSIYACHEDRTIFLGSGSDILQFNVLEYKKQIEQYLNISGKGSSLGNIKDPNNDLRIIGLDKAISLVSKLDTKCPFFYNKEVSNEKKKYLELRDLYKSKAVLLFESYSKYHESLVDICSDWMIAYPDVLELFPDFLNGDSKIRSVLSNDADETKSIRSTHNVVKRVSKEDIQTLRFATTAESGTENEADRRTMSSRATSPQKVPNRLQGYAKSQNMRKFSKAVNNLIIYLTDQRRIHMSFLNGDNIQWKGIEISPLDIYPNLSKEDLKNKLHQAATTIDTSLFLCYFHTKPMLLGPLLRLPNNHCNASVVNECLMSNIHNHVQQRELQQPNFIKELLDFYFTRGLHKDALEMLYRLSHNDEEEETHSNDDDNAFDDFLKGPDLTIQYLKKMTNQDLDLVFQFSYWVIVEETDFHRSVEKIRLIFMNDSYECENYDNFKVLNYFTQVLKNDAFGIIYLEWLNFESDLVDHLSRKKTLGKFHTKLCLLYLKQLKEVKDEYDLDSFTKIEYYVKLYNFLGSTSLYEPWTVLKSIPTTEDKFLRFTIFIYKRLGEHDKSIDVLFNQLNDLDAAMQYCCDIYQLPNSQNIGEQLLHKLLEDLLMNYHENVESIEKLLTLQGSKMSILRVMTALPNSFPLHRLEKFLTSHMRGSQETLHDARIASQLYKVGSIKLQDRIWKIQSQEYPIASGKQLCTICNKRLGYSVFSVGKDNQIVHYGCAQRALKPARGSSP
ncbi:vacuolar carboxypeptidase Y [Scheffersomyces stipitis CBS 6054]|uniref:Vacuolar carboxypeptidase Y n=1 Tax=Scheffersomyces stipitis (strain ATCC 58785 / CBS 6054 / NBRC 10063 / NRRL Y-11545) TaxID=322104 RepID=A3LUK3_PICST|nr:vacuolar carboxypeptidase Y [Scheffersomyces stipitis CBS 6054]ABN66606.2 vacuolar carboxypeptidase Y [Scheffersomyces stipitis CBS 6054]